MSHLMTPGQFATTTLETNPKTLDAFADEFKNRPTARHVFRMHRQDVAY